MNLSKKLLKLHNQASIVITDYQCNKLSALHILGADTLACSYITKRYTLYNTRCTIHCTHYTKKGHPCEVPLLYRNILEQESCIDVEGAVAVLFLDGLVAAELAYRQTVLEGYDEVLVHDEAQAGTHGDMRTVVREA